MVEQYVNIEMKLSDYYLLRKYAEKHLTRIEKSREYRRAERDTKKFFAVSEMPLAVIIETKNEPSEEYKKYAQKNGDKNSDI